MDLLARTNGNVETGGKADVESLKLELTVVSNVKGDDALMQEYVWNLGCF